MQSAEKNCLPILNHFGASDDRPADEDVEGARAAALLGAAGAAAADDAAECKGTRDEPCLDGGSGLLHHRATDLFK